MAYIVNIQTGSRERRNFSRSQSIPLPNKQRVRAWIRRNATGNSSTPITIKNTRTKKLISLSKGSGEFFGRNILTEIKRRKN